MSEAKREGLRRTICCLTRGLTKGTRQRVEEAGRNLASEIAFYGEGTRSEPADLLVAVLPVGQRRVPQDVVERLSTMRNDCRVLLLCEEPLNRQCVGLQNGRLLMVGLPLTTGQIEAGLKYGLVPAQEFECVQAATQADAEDLWVVDDLQPPVLSRLQQYRGPSWWSAAMCWAPPGHGDGTPERLIAVRSRDDRFAGLLSLNGDPISEDSASSVLDGLPGSGSDPRLRGALTENTAAVWLDLQCGHWGVYGPGPATSCFLISSLRFPPYTELGPRLRTSGNGWVSLPFTAGDVLLLGTGLKPEWFASLRGTRSEGTPRGLSLIRMVDAHWRAQDCMGVGLIVEVCG